MASVKSLKNTSILAVAQALGLVLKRVGSDNYQWVEHPSLTINTTRNIFSWFKYDKHGDVFELVQTIREEQTGTRPSFKEAKRFLETGHFDQIEIVEPEKKPFVYSLSEHEVAEMPKARAYLIHERGLSEETIRFFESQGVLAEATYRYQGEAEPVVVFKARDREGKVVGASLQGIVANPTKHERGRLKRLMKGTDGYYGMSVTIGKPKRLVFAEAPIDLMSYYELHKNTLSDVRLVAMDGLKEGTISHYYMALQAELAGQEYTFERTKTPRALSRVAAITRTFHDDQNKDIITLAIDNDEAGRKFIKKLEDKGIGLTSALPPLNKGESKVDWNDYLKQNKEALTEIKDYQVRIQWSESPLFNEQEGTTMSYKTFVQKAYEANEHLFQERHGGTLDTITEYGLHPYQKTKFDLLDPDGTVIDVDLRYNIGDESQPLSQILEHHPYAQDLAEIDQVVIDNIKTSPDKNLEMLNDRTNMSWGSLEETPQGSAEPVSKDDTFEQTVTSHPTLSYPPLKFSTDNREMSSVRGGYHVITPEDLRNLNYYASTLQETAQWYLKTVADSEVVYFYQNGDSVEAMTVNYGREKFAHLTGVRPIGRDLSAVKVLERFATGQGHFDNITVSRSFVDKIQVLPLFQEITQAKSFVFDHLSEIKKMKSLNAQRAIRTDNKHLIVAFRTMGDISFPVSVLKPSHKLNLALEREQEGNIILGVFQKKGNTIQTLSINDTIVKDKGQELKALLEAGDLEPLESVVFKEENRQSSLEQVSSVSEEKAETTTVNDYLAKNDIKGLAAHMKSGIKDYLNSKQYKRFLTTMAKFPRYSTRNIQLILAQNPNATYVTSFKQWKETFERSVNKGEKAMRIWAPMTIKQRDPETGKVLLDEKGNEKTALRFKLVPVFDVSQTKGKDLPKAIHELEGTHKDYANLYRAAKAYAESKGVKVIIDHTLKEAKGYYAAKDQTIALKGGMSEQQTLKTFFHELAHSDLHASKEQTANLKYSHAELQAESVAYVVANHYGFDTSDYSFGYLASWVDDKQALSDLEAQLDIVQREAKALITSMDSFLEAQLTKTPKVNSLESRLEALSQEVNVSQTVTKEGEQSLKKDQAEVQERT
ncbi:PBECR4 domain-containing protein [Streptococcus suis]|nr:PBECR4 domain-containing protein [Streptococcus suis]